MMISNKNAFLFVLFIQQVIYLPVTTKILAVAHIAHSEYSFIADEFILTNPNSSKGYCRNALQYLKHLLSGIQKVKVNQSKAFGTRSAVANTQDTFIEHR